VLRYLRSPSSLVQALRRSYPVGSFDLRCRFDIFGRPNYAYGIQQAAYLAKRVGAPGDQRHRVRRRRRPRPGRHGGNRPPRLPGLRLRIEVFGFDRAVGLPKAADFRDLPYTWEEGFFTMDVAQLESRLFEARLVLGDISDTVPTFVEKFTPAPIGFVAIDLAY
jgi:hypothetical protein